MESDTHTFLCDQENIFGIIGSLNFDQFIVITKYNRLKTVLADIAVFLHRSLLNHTIAGCHEEIFLIIDLLHRNDGCDLLAWHQRKQIHDGSTSGSASCLRNLVSLQTVYASLVGKEHHIMMGCGHQQIFDIIFLNSLHALDSLAAAVLALEIIAGHSLNIAKIGHGHNDIVIRDQILRRHIVFIISDGGTAVISVFISDEGDLLLDNTQKFLLICQNRFQLCNLCLQLFIFIFQFLAFQTGQSTQTHIYDGLCLCIRKIKTLH